MQQLVKKLLSRFGYDIVKYAGSTPELNAEERKICQLVAPYTMTSIEKIIALIQAVKYISRNKIEGDIVECGVWRGGSMMVVAYMLHLLGDTQRKLYLYDTFTGMSNPTNKDLRFDNTPADKLIKATPAKKSTRNDIICYADLQDVTNNLHLTGYPKQNIIFVEGKVEDTIPAIAPDHISLLRLDTDWYESTKHELTHLYPKLSPNGTLIVDDYGYWKGSRDAVDEYFEHASIRIKPLLHRIDFSGRLIIKPN